MRTVDLAGETRTAMLTTSPVTVNLVLKELLDDLADTAPPAEQTADYRKGFSAGIRFVRICVLDEIAAVSGGLARVPMAARRHREQQRIRTALQTIRRRVAEQATPGDDDSAAGYRDAVAVALEMISRLMRRAAESEE
ncbi:Uncharacterised protein [Mycolicibacterium phlei]|uniref:hypothetical protein n=1 Tax=Mycolicibacterium phlei TaxID=1771 RepID=UPI0003061664|nr:hypothetical protein [Mycolicibacterium phlei]AMO63268.1 hypothetical protein MPHLCCUG_04482 [Mycolicibacterium phlei]STZ21728.1 Uncharacterised protein [Mycolicibacterium phlei]VEG11365.1 Uncharacterised protein [Mycobacteroides chelonae]